MTVIGLIGSITNPLPAYGSYLSATVFLSNIIRLITIAAGVFAMVNFVLAGIGYIQSAGNPEGVQRAWQKIYMSVIGVSVIILSFAFAALLGQLLYGDVNAILKPKITGPGA